MMGTKNLECSFYSLASIFPVLQLIILMKHSVGSFIAYISVHTNQL